MASEYKQKRIVFLLEEPSMKSFLQNFLPRLFPNWIEKENFLLIPHEGKSDLDRSIPKKLRSWQYPNDRFVILRDNDNQNCFELKEKFIQICKDSNRPDTLIRLVCQELEAWYLGDLHTLEKSFEKEENTINTPKNQKKYRYPDDITKPSRSILELIPEFQKITGAAVIGKNLPIPMSDENTSKSFQVFINGLRRVVCGDK